MDINEINRIFNRQAVRGKAELREVNCPEAYIVVMNKFFDYAKEDIINEWRMENGMGKDTNR